jgi:hypothetical protein
VVLLGLRAFNTEGTEEHRGNREIINEMWPAVWLTRWVGGAGDPSLRLRSGSAQEDNDHFGYERYSIIFKPFVTNYE